MLRAGIPGCREPNTNLCRRPLLPLCRCGVNGQWRPVDVRAMQVAGEYETSAKRLDHQHHSSDDGPVLRVAALRGYPLVRGHVVGAYGEASADVHALLKLTAAKKAETAFKQMGPVPSLRLRPPSSSPSGATGV